MLMADNVLLSDPSRRLIRINDWSTLKRPNVGSEKVFGQPPFSHQIIKRRGGRVLISRKAGRSER